MPAPRKLTLIEIQYARTTMALRREALQRASIYPTLEQMAEKLNVTPRYLREVINGRARTEGSTGNILTAEVAV